jgi:hypothetical protein
VVVVVVVVAVVLPIVVVVVVVVVVVALDPAGIETHTSSWKISKKNNFHFPELITRTGFRQWGTYLSQALSQANAHPGSHPNVHSI